MQPEFGEHPFLGASEEDLKMILHLIEVKEMEDREIKTLLSWTAMKPGYWFRSVAVIEWLKQHKDLP